ncbi:hypothetical protein [Flavobacterium piscis]|uniref:DUF3124 domain-containing protein n=1 Tax=Flavobacterium piscis TaxID=1114874 RepID=A0ABU1Y3K9_9FLAO|nr:hypothetical protein [Flavobacterium piscis]MDR7208820.1 hypothetical protein [Flavobacterium piscis]
MTKTLLSIYLPLLCLLSSCAGITHNEVTDESKNKGFRYYNSSPYLLAYSNGKGGVTTQIIFLADPQKKMSAAPYNFLASIQATMEFEKGIYKNGKTTADGTVVLSSIAKAVETVAPLILAALNAPELTEREVPAPYLYKIVIDGDKVNFIGGQGDISVKVNILKQKENAK